MTILRLVLNEIVKLSILTRYRSGEAASWIQLRPIDLDRYQGLHTFLTLVKTFLFRLGETEVATFSLIDLQPRYT